jgi:hypothetical protein
VRLYAHRLAAEHRAVSYRQGPCIYTNACVATALDPSIFCLSLLSLSLNQWDGGGETEGRTWVKTMLPRWSTAASMRLID